jgi:hypothetical protein
MSPPLVQEDILPAPPALPDDEDEDMMDRSDDDISDGSISKMCDMMH